MGRDPPRANGQGRRSNHASNMLEEIEVGPTRIEWPVAKRFFHSLLAIDPHFDLALGDVMCDTDAVQTLQYPSHTPQFTEVGALTCLVPWNHIHSNEAPVFGGAFDEKRRSALAVFERSVADHDSNALNKGLAIVGQSRSSDTAQLKLSGRHCSNVRTLVVETDARGIAKTTHAWVWSTEAGRRSDGRVRVTSERRYLAMLYLALVRTR